MTDKEILKLAENHLTLEKWEDIFTVDSDLDADASIDVLVDRIDKEFIPPSSEKNGYEWEKCLKIMRDKLRQDTSQTGTRALELGAPMTYNKLIHTET